MIPPSRRGAMFLQKHGRVSGPKHIWWVIGLTSANETRKELVLQFQVLSLTTLNQTRELWSAGWHFLDVASFQCLGFSTEVISAVKMA